MWVDLGAVTSRALGVAFPVKGSASRSRLAEIPPHTALVVDVAGVDGVAGRPPLRLTSLPLVLCAGRVGPLQSLQLIGAPAQRQSRWTRCQFG